MAGDKRPIRDILTYSLGAFGAIGSLIAAIQDEAEGLDLISWVLFGAFLWMAIGVAVGWAIDRARGIRPQSPARPSEPEPMTDSVPTPEPEMPPVAPDPAAPTPTPQTSAPTPVSDVEPPRAARVPTAATPAPDPAATAAVADSLRQLKALHDEGILTDSEYEAKRKALAEKL